ncbi:protein NUCLEAR FUSION DEFECTIVE 6, mitochondrial [Lotus japonicus]|uniref:protein NUCLEAR FUSION DEFECTIVE 6, mitochondrial n=1 Tax=Lotus japonicus TaxID=34305 RepID=UPI002583BD29|nr:protein NUCLEAR FUSION DEFECTIVE 6, mitochondrial [Lotus japonicus]
MAVAAKCARKTLQQASSSTKTLFSRRSSSPSSASSSPFATKFNGSPSSSSQFATHKRPLSCPWFPVQLAGAQVSLTPLHSATASALFTSLLSLHNTNWGCLSEGFATPL